MQYRAAVQAKILNVYCISGLGADEKAFSRIRFEKANLHFVQWVEHHPNDTLHEYVQKLVDQIDAEHPFALIGLSFGGIIAQEMNKMISPEKTILISSVTHHRQFPWFYQVGRVIVPVLSDRFFTHTNRLINYMFGAKGKNTQVLDNILAQNDPKFVKWCVNALLRWRKRGETPRLVTIHGTNDKIVPYHPCDYAVKDGSHFMVYSRAPEVQRILEKEIYSLLPSQ